MAPQRIFGQTDLRARQVPQSIRFLRSLGVPATRLAGIFSENADNIRHIDSRSYKEERIVAGPPTVNSDDLALLGLSRAERERKAQRQIQGLRLRSKRELDQVEAAVWAIFRSNKSVGLSKGYAALLAMLPGVANARHAQALRVRLLLEEKLAWFALPLDRIDVALQHARRAMKLAIRAFRESAGAKDYLLRYGESALVASLCFQKMHQPEQAMRFTAAADQANDAAGQVPGSEHLRQRGATLLQMGSRYDDHADRAFTKAPKRMQRKNEAHHPLDLDMVGLRQQSFLRPAWGWEKSVELANSVKQVYGAKSMPYEVAAKSAALSGLKLATKEATETSLELLDGISADTSHGVRHILSITPQLRLSAEDLDLWLRFAMNESPLPPRN